MQSRRWNELYRLVGETAGELPRGSRRFADRVIVLVLLWAAFNHRPISWATRRPHWPVWMQRLLPVVPSNTTMSRRLRRQSVQTFLAALLVHVQGDVQRTLVQLIDGTALEVRKHTTDPHAKIGWSSGGRGCGYKLHVKAGTDGSVYAWVIAPMHRSEKIIARRLLREDHQAAYLVADGNYDSTTLHRLACKHGSQLVAPLRTSRKRRAKRMHPGRQRAKEMLEGPSPIGRDLLIVRSAIERFFAHADGHSEGLGELPAWVRTHRRVHRWVHAKLIINAVRLRLLREERKAA